MSTTTNRKEGKKQAEKPVASSQSSSQSTGGLLASVRDKVNSAYREIDPVADAFRFRSRPSRGEILAQPLVFMLGNHSSGKSSMINFLLSADGEAVELQKTGTAPLDDCFTIISYAEAPTEKDGPAIVANKSLPYASLSNLKGDFMQHLRMKSLKNNLLKHVTLVDSPGMIDSVGDGRGYDFVEAVKWWVQRADITYFFLDPEKPGTTGEALSVLTECMGGIEHKLRIVFNKVDTLSTLTDMTRTFGTVCWNLAKVIKFKDMPQIALSYLPNKHSAAMSRSYELTEFDASRNEIRNKIRQAPKKHADNLVTDLGRTAEHLEMHAKVISSLRNQYWWWRLQTLALFVTFFVISGGLVHVLQDSTDLWKLLTIPIFTFLVLALLYPRLARAQTLMLVQPHFLRETFEKLYASELLSDEVDRYERLYLSIAPGVLNVLSKFPLLSFPSLRSGAIATLGKVADEVQGMLGQVHKVLSRQKNDSSYDQDE